MRNAFFGKGLTPNCLTWACWFKRYNFHGGNTGRAAGAEGLAPLRAEGLWFRRQQTIGVYIVDFFCASRKLVVELDGPIHDSTEEYDQARDQYFAGLGLTILRFKNDRSIVR